MGDKNGDLERKIEFLVDGQAQLTAKMDRLVEGQELLTRSMLRMSDRTGKIENHLDAATAVVEHIARQIAQLAESQRYAQEASEQRFKALDDRLNILVHVVERDISSRGPADLK
ncbi:MAG: hypothetical protein ACYDA9_08045 [Terriglobia bacterium]